jgi:protein-L-isoaspartate O-methyltransferase
MARLQRALAQCHDMVIRRGAVLEALQLHSGERVLEIGCGGGFYAHEAAQCVGTYRSRLRFGPQRRTTRSRPSALCRVPMG